MDAPHNAWSSLQRSRLSQSVYLIASRDVLCTCSLVMSLILASCHLIILSPFVLLGDAVLIVYSVFSLLQCLFRVYSANSFFCFFFTPRLLSFFPRENFSSLRCSSFLSFSFSFSLSRRMPRLPPAKTSQQHCRDIYPHGERVKNSPNSEVISPLLPPSGVHPASACELGCFGSPIYLSSVLLNAGDTRYRYIRSGGLVTAGVSRGEFPQNLFFFFFLLILSLPLSLSC